jgi:hypothetical protein
MNTHKRNKVLYWVLTLLVLFPTAGSAIPELFMRSPQAAVRSYQSLGYPLYLMKILGFAKIIGAIAILTNRSRHITEWAYAGFGILFLGATASHFLAGDPTHAPIPALLFIVLAGSYAFWSRNDGRAFNHAEKL